MKIATARKKTSTHWRTQDITWEQFLDKLRKPLRTGETAREYKAMSKAERDLAKEAAGGFVAGALSCGQRKTANVTERSMITLDADNAKPQAWETAVAFLDYRMCCYSTHSHTEAAPRLRWIIPTDRPMTPDEYPAVARRVATWLDQSTMDATTYEVARLMYWPTCSKDGAYCFHEQEGPVIRVDDVLATYGYGDAWRNCDLWPMADNEMTIRQQRQKQAGEPTEKPGMVGLFCRTYDVPAAIDEFLSDVYTEAVSGGETRYTYAKGSTAGGAVVYNDGAFLYSNHATDPCGGFSVNAFDLVRIHKFGHLDGVNDCEDTRVTELPSYAAMITWCSDLPEIKKQMLAEKSESMAQDFEDIGEDDEEEDRYTDGPDWESKLAMNKKTGEMEPTLNNAILYLRNHPDFKGKFGYNPMADDITVDGDMPWTKKRKRNKRQGLENIIQQENDARKRDGIWDIEIEGGDFLAYFERFGYTTKGAKNGMLENALKVVALENTYHPIKSYLEELEWDGKKRVETMFVRWLGAEDDELNHEITKLWMIGAVDRIIRPGHQFDSIIITCGPQGIGKSKLLRLLSKGHYTNALSTVGMDKKTAEILQDVWIIELGELDSIKRGEQTAIKNFITATSDRYRTAYARQASTHPRQCVFAGTTNEGSFLRDNTGERRYWVMPVTGVGDGGELHGFENEVDQLWAEAVQMWKDRVMEFHEPFQTLDDVNLYLYLRDPKLKEEMEARQNYYKLPEEDRMDVEGYLDTLRPDNWEELQPYERRNFAKGEWIGDKSTCHYRVNKVCIKELKNELFDGKADKSLRIGAILDNMDGWRKANKRRFPMYAEWPQPCWVRIGSDEDY